MSVAVVVVVELKLVLWRSSARSSTHGSIGGGGVRILGERKELIGGAVFWELRMQRKNYRRESIGPEAFFIFHFFCFYSNFFCLIIPSKLKILINYTPISHDNI